MAEIKNSFLKSKMNKDLDDRLIPNGEYRDAQNISVGKSEADDIGALETVLGNELATDFGLTPVIITETNNTAAPVGPSFISEISITGDKTATIKQGMTIHGTTTNGVATEQQVSSVVYSAPNTIVQAHPGGWDVALNASVTFSFEPKVIGYYSDDIKNKIIVFITDYRDMYSAVTVPYIDNSCYIFSFTPNTTPISLSTGTFLNFSKSSLITGINTIEDLLFWTDNRNQPRKINIQLAIDNLNYYTNESNISVAKYNPYQPIGLLNKVKTTTTTVGASTTIVVASATGIYKGMSVVQYGNTDLEPEDYIYVTEVNGGSAFDSLVGGTGYTTATGVATTVSPTGGTGLTVDITDTAGVVTAVSIASPGSGYNINDVITITGGGGNATITLTAVNYITINASTTIVAGDVWFFSTTMTGEDITLDFNGGSAWPGDPDYLEDKFVRFSYRFEFDDGEYSLMAPFTQITYIPKQKGYFLGSGITAPAVTATAVDENDAYQSTIVELMENGVQDIDLLIPFPDILSNIDDDRLASYKIQNCQVLYKESDARAVKVLDTIASSAWTGTTTTNIHTYNYQSRKPFRVLPENQTVRVYDKVPVKALAQETSGNRIIYGNFLDKYTPPSLLEYTVAATDKSLLESFDNWVEYPNHSLKQNRNYQVGFILADKFGRQSDVILSSIKLTSVLGFGGDTIYHPYNTASNQGTIRDWFGDALRVKISSPITSGTDSGPNATGDEPGLYAKMIGNGYNTYNANTIYQPTISGNTYIFHLGLTYTDVPAINTHLEGEYTDYVKVSNVATSVESTTSSDNTAGGATTALVLVTGNADIKVGMVVSGGGLPVGVTIVTVTDSQNFVLSSTQTIPLNSSLTYSITEYTITTIGQVSSIYLQQSISDPDKKFSYNINEIGWYSYKIVVKQQEQDYYNVYLPGIVKGYPYQDLTATNTPFFPDIPTGSFISNAVLFNDNINKVPRDLSEVGPQQKQFRSSVQLFGRVENTMAANTPDTDPGIPNNIQYFPGIASDTAITISAASDANMGYEIFQDSQANARELYSTLSTTGQASMYQLDSNPLIARLSTFKDIGAASLISASTATPSMVPYLAIYETEPQESLLEIFWETSTVGLISTLNDAILSDYDGATGWETYNSNNFKEAPAANFIANLSPVDSSGSVIDNTSLSSFAVIDGDGNTKTSNFTLPVKSGAGIPADPHKYTFAQAGTDFVFNYNSNPRTYTMSMVITNDDSGTVSSTLSMPIELQNVDPVISPAAPSALIGINDGFTGVLATDTYTGVNGATNTVLELQELKWSISAGNSNNYFEINALTGVLSKIVSGAATVGAHTLTIKLEDAWNGSALASGSSNDTVTQSITVTSSIIGNMFEGSAMVNQTDACPAFGAAPSDCDSVDYYSQSALVGGLPTAGSTILTGSGGPGVSPPAADGYYALRDAPGPCATGSARMYMKIDDGAGTVKAGYPITCGP